MGFWNCLLRLQLYFTTMYALGNIGTSMNFGEGRGGGGGGGSDMNK